MVDAKTLMKTVAVQGVGALAALLVAVVVSRRMGPAGQGFWAQFRSILDFVAVLVAYGFPMTFPFLINARNVPARGLAMFTAAYGVLLIPVVAGGIGAAWTFGLLELASGKPRTEVPLLAVSVAATTMYAMLRGIVLASAPSGAFNTVTAAAPLVLLAAVGIWPLSGVDDLMWAAAAGAWAALGFATLTWWHCGRRRETPARRALPFGDLVVLGGWNFVVALCAAAMPLLTFQLLRSAGVSPEDIGCFSLAVLAYGAVLTPANMAGPLVYSAWSSADSAAQIKVAYSKLLRWAVAVSALGAVVAGGALPYVLPAIVGDGFVATITPAWVLLVAAPLGYWSRLLANALLASGHARAYAEASILRLVGVLVILSSPDAPTIVDAAVAWAVSEVGSIALLVFHARRLLGWRISEASGLSVCTGS